MRRMSVLWPERLRVCQAVRTARVSRSWAKIAQPVQTCWASAPLEPGAVQSVAALEVAEAALGAGW